MRILTVGAGAVGGYFGGRLLEAGRDVTFLVRAARAEHMRVHGLQILSPHGNLFLRPPVITVPQLSEPYELLLVAVKNYALESAMNDFAPAVGPATMILPALNGMRHIDLLAAHFGNDRVIGGVCRVAAEIDAGGRIRQLADFQSLAYGELDGRRTPRIRNADAALHNAGFAALISDHIVQDMWDKWVQLAALGAINCLFRGSIGQIVAVPGGAALCRALLDECAVIAQTCGYRPSQALLDRLAADLTTPGSSMTSSMYRDLRKGLQVEAETILGDLLARGRQHGLNSPLFEAAFMNLSIYQQEHTASRRPAMTSPREDSA